MPSVFDPFRGVKVEVVSQGRSLDLYDDPEADQIVEGSNPEADQVAEGSDAEADQVAEENKAYYRTLYVEANTGATFAVRVTISKDFDFYSLGPEDAVQACIRYDGPSFGDRVHSTRNLIERGLTTEGSLLLYNGDRVWGFCKSSGHWTKGAPVFSAMTIDETDKIKITPEQIKRLGSIQVRIDRCHRRKLHTPRAFYLPAEDSITAVSEKMIKGKAIANVVKLQDTTIKQPEPQQHELSCLKGEVGRPLKIEIRYRSRQNLQSLGLIPRTPTPEPDLREQNRALRERLALLERSGSANIKAESSRSAASIKREREGAETRRDNKRPCGLGGIEMVDLTGD